MAGLLEGLFRWVKSGMRADVLPPPPPEPAAPPRRSLLRAVFAPEPLPEAPPPPPRDRPSFLAVLFAREALPFDPEPPRRPRHWLAYMFARDRLDPPGGPGPEVH